MAKQIKQPRARTAKAKALPDVVLVPPLPENLSAAFDAGREKLTAYENRLNRTRKYQHEQTRMERDIAPLPIDNIDWDLRNACKFDPKLFFENYLSATFYLDWSEDQLRCIEKTKRVFLSTYKFALAMPRGGGKTAICRGGIVWGTGYGHKRFPFFVGSRQGSARATLKAVKMQWYRNPLLLRDFPEIAYPIRRIENRFHMAKGQLFNDEPTLIEWGMDEVQYPSLVLPREVAEVYLEHDPDSLVWVEQLSAYIPKSAGCMIGTIGIDGSFRGENRVHAVTMEEIRPDVILLDDIQNDKKAKSPISVTNLINLVDGAVEGLAGPDSGVSVLMPCTVIMENDVADTYVNPAIRPDYNGERCRLVASWPPGVTDTEITKDTESACAWNDYLDIRLRSLRIYGDNRLATEFYSSNREVMDKDFVVTWEQRIVKDQAISAQQNAMELRIKSPVTFVSEYQNIGRSVEVGNVNMISTADFQAKQSPLPKGHIPIDAIKRAAFIDVQDEFLIYGIAAAAPDFTGVIADYGIWPPVSSMYFTRRQANSWNGISRLFFEKYPQHLKDAVRTKKGRIKAPGAMKIYFAVRELLAYLKSYRLILGDENKSEVPIDAIGIDARYETDAIKQLVRELNDRSIHVCFGQQLPPTNKQMDEYIRTPGWLFEDMVNPDVKKVKFIEKIGADFFPYIANDGDAWKDFLFERLGTAPGAPSSISLYKTSVENHLMFAQQVCDSEYPEEVIARGLAKNLWKERENGPDNEYLDVSYGLMSMLSYLGCCPRIVQIQKQSKQNRSLRAMYDAKRKGKSA
jgi:hypothetical protein